MGETLTAYGKSHAQLAHEIRERAKRRNPKAAFEAGRKAEQARILGLIEDLKQKKRDEIRKRWKKAGLKVSPSVKVAENALETDFDEIEKLIRGEIDGKK